MAVAVDLAYSFDPAETFDLAYLDSVEWLASLPSRLEGSYCRRLVVALAWLS